MALRYHRSELELTGQTDYRGQDARAERGISQQHIKDASAVVIMVLVIIFGAAATVASWHILVFFVDAVFQHVHISGAALASG